jgi:hypothetical protein
MKNRLRFNEVLNEGPVKPFLDTQQEAAIRLQGKEHFASNSKTTEADVGYHYRAVSRILICINKCRDLGGSEAVGCDQTWKDYKRMHKTSQA